MTNAETLIHVEGLKKHYNHGRIRALDGIDIDINKGDVMVVIGPSGSGKSTFLRSLNLLEEPTEGKIVFHGVDIASGKVNLDEHRQKMGMVFQHFNLFPHKTILENLTIAPIKVKHMDKAAAEEKALKLLDRVGLKDRANAYPVQLSGGQKQRVGIARALANDPEVLLSDEATSALDPETTVATLELLKKINRELKLTIVMITHQMDVVKQICDRVAVMNKGVVVEEGSVIDVFRHPKHETTQALIGNIMAQKLPPSMIERVRTQIKAIDSPEPSHVLRLSFVGEEVTRPVISEASRIYNINFNILLGQIDEVQGKGFGTLTVLITCANDVYSGLLDYLRRHNITVEEVTSHVL